LKDYAVDLLTRMVETYSPTGREEPLASLLVEEMKGLGFEVERDAVGNVIGTFEGGRPKVLFCGHMDTVPPELPVKLKDGILYGRGVVDAKAPLASMICAAAQLIEEGYEGGLVVAGVVDEEGRNIGIERLIERRLDVDYAVFGEPTDVDTVTVGYKGGLLFKVTCETETGHSSASWLFENAVEKGFEVWGLIKGLRMPQEDMESRFHSLSACLMRMEGGRRGSVVPDRCEMQIGFRIPPAISVGQLQSVVVGVIYGYSKDNPSVRVAVEVLDSTEPYVAEKRSPLVRAFARAIWKRRGVRAKLVKKTGTGDMNNYGLASDTPVVTYGPGDAHLDHTPHEKVSVEDYLESIEVLKETVRILHENHDKT
jgi:LysW-gamma-L-lysine carboxypeptidase